MRTRSKVLAGVAAIIMTAGALTGCSSDTEGGQEPATSESSTNATSDPDTTESPGSTDTTEPTDSTEEAAPVLQPNLRSLAAADLQIEQIGNRRRLRFASTLANAGPGPLILKPGAQGRCPDGEHAAHQFVHVDSNGDGRFERAVDQQRRRKFTGCMLFHTGHDHWHFDAMAAYRLRLPGTDRSVAHRPKVSFCLRDNRRLPGVEGGVPREHYGECGPRRVQGISPGWADVYGAELDGQWLMLPENFADGLICLDLEADPRQLVDEADETDNAITTAVQITGDQATAATGRAAARCS